MPRSGDWPDTINVSRADMNRRRAVADDLNRRYEWRHGRRRRNRWLLVVMSALFVVVFYLTKAV